MKLDQRTVLLVLLILGIADSAYLTIVHFVPGALECPTIGTLVNCEQVVTSSLSNVFGVPLAVLGLIWFVASLLFLLLGYNKIVKNVWMIIGVGGIIYSIMSQAIIGRLCIYCSLLDVIIALSVGMFVYFKGK